jgi:hypothetical protein
VYVCKIRVSSFQYGSFTRQLRESIFLEDDRNLCLVLERIDFAVMDTQFTHESQIIYIELQEFYVGLNIHFEKKGLNIGSGTASSSASARKTAFENKSRK